MQRAKATRGLAKCWKSSGVAAIGMLGSHLLYTGIGIGTRADNKEVKEAIWNEHTLYAMGPRRQPV